MGEEGAHLLGSHFLRMTNAVKADKSLDPINISLLRARAVVVEPDRCPDAIEEFGRFRTG